MSRKKVFGNCRICGTHAELHFEHVPSKAAFNNRPAVGKYALELINKDPDHYFDRKGHKYQRGVGAYTLCEKCNNNTGTWYSGTFANFAHQSLDILKHAKRHPSLYYQFRVYPLQVIKQIITMFFSVNDDLFRGNHPELVKFILDKNERYLSPDFRILVYFNSSPRGRSIGGVSMTKMSPDEINPDTMENLHRRIESEHAKSRLLSEIAFPPLGYVMTFNPEQLDKQLFDISFFTKYRYDDWRSIPLKLPVYPVHTWFPTDYRSPEQVQRDFEKNSRIEKENQERKQREANPAEPAP